MLIVALMAVGALVVEGSARCPTAAEVSARLEPLLSDGTGELLARATIDDRDGVLALELDDAHGDRVAQRVFERSSACAELADAAAVVLAAWLTELPARVASLPSLPSLPSAPEEVRASLLPRVVIAPPIISSEAHALQVELGVAASLSYARAFAPGASLEVTIGSREDAVRVRGALFGALPREDAFAIDHRYAWARTGLSLGVVRAIISSGVGTLDARLALDGALLSVGGRGFAVDRQSYDFDPGIEAALRGTFGRAFVELALTGWLRSQRVVAGGLPDSATLPRLEVAVSVGARFWGGQ